MVQVIRVPIELELEINISVPGAEQCSDDCRLLRLCEAIEAELVDHWPTFAPLPKSLWDDSLY